MGIVVWIVVSTLVQHQFYILLLCLIGFHLGFIFWSLNTILFLLGFEVILVLMYFLINNWGSKLYKIRSSFYLLLFTIFGSLFLFIALVILYVITGSTNFILLENFQFITNQQISLTICFICGFGRLHRPYTARCSTRYRTDVERNSKVKCARKMGSPFPGVG